VSNSQHDVVIKRLLAVFDDAFQHDGFSDFKVEVKILKRQQKEVIIHYGKQYRYILDYMNTEKTSDKLQAHPRKLASIDS
jgi:hypothetical protein